MSVYHNARNSVHDIDENSVVVLDYIEESDAAILLASSNVSLIVFFSHKDLNQNASVFGLIIPPFSIIY
jgi:hypothetical protein